MMLITSASQPCLPLRTQEEIVHFCRNLIAKGQLMPLLHPNLTAASLVTRSKKHEHVTSVLVHNWHQLPVHKRTSFKNTFDDI